MTKASDNAFPSILITEGTEPSAPAAGKQRLYIDSTTHKLKRTDSSGTDVTIEPTGSSFDPDTHLPWRIDINPVVASASNTNWSTIGTQSLNFGGFGMVSSGAQNAEINFDVVLAAGTWSVKFLHVTGTTRGIYSVQIDDSEKGTVDGYAGSSTGNNIGSVTSISVATTGKHELAFKMLTKNASSSSYIGVLGPIALLRTA